MHKHLDQHYSVNLDICLQGTACDTSRHEWIKWKAEFAGRSFAVSCSFQV